MLCWHIYLLGANYQVQTAYHQPECEPSIDSGGGSHKMSSTSKRGNDNSPGCSSDIPIGLGVGGLQPKVRRCFLFAVFTLSFVFSLTKTAFLLMHLT